MRLWRVFARVACLWRRVRRRKSARSWVPESPAELIAAWQRVHGARSLGAALNLARSGRGLSLLQLQTATGIGAAYLVKLEHDLVPQPSLFALVQLAEALDLDLEALLARLSRRAYSPLDLLELERRWRLCLAAQPGNRNGLQMLRAIQLLRDRTLDRV